MRKTTNADLLSVPATYWSPGKCKEQVFLAWLSTAAEAMYNLRKEPLFLGDFNMDLYNIAEGRAPNSRLVDFFCERFCLVNNILEPTCVTSTTKSLIDVVLTSIQERFSFSATLQLGLSDHDLIYQIYVVRKNKLPRPKPRFVE